MRLTWRKLRKNRLQFASMIAITLLAVTLFCGFISNTKTLEKAINSYFDSANLYDLCVQTKRISDKDKAYFASLDPDTEYRVYAEGTMDEKSVKLYVGDNSVSRPLVKTGKAGVLIEQRTAELNHIPLGAGITLGVTMPLGNTSINATVQTEVTGFMNFVESSSSSSSSAVYISEEKFAEMVNAKIKEEFPFINRLYTASDFYNQALLKTSAPDALKEDITACFSDGDNLIFIYDRNNTETAVLLNDEVSQSRKMLYVFPVISCSFPSLSFSRR